MPIQRVAQAIPVSVPGLQVTSYGTSTAVPIGISRDNATVYGSVAGGQTASSNVLYQTVNNGTTWTTVFTFSSTERVQGIRETDDGEAIVITQDNAASPGYVYKSTGWSTSHTTATWTKVLTSTGGYFRAYWAGGHPWSFGDDTISAGTSKIGIISEYGAQTTSSGDQTSRARRAWITQDYGTTWTLVLDLVTRYPTVFTMHMHFVAYDPYWNRLWALIGDNPAAEGTANAPILYSDDLGVTWTSVPLTGTWAATGAFQSTSMALLPDSIIIGSDNAPGFLRVARKGYRKLGQFEITANIAGHTGGQMIATSAHQNRRQPGAPVLVGLLAQITTVAPAIYGSLDGGQTMARLWSDTVNVGNNNQVTGIFGPTINGKVLATVLIGATYNMLVGEIIDPGTNMRVGSPTITGDGTTTVFSFAHGLGAKPNRFNAWNEKAVGTYTVTADATNVIVTFTTAPTSGSYPFQWRAGA